MRPAGVHSVATLADAAKRGAARHPQAGLEVLPDTVSPWNGTAA